MSRIPALDRLGEGLEEAIARDQAVTRSRHQRRHRLRWRVAQGSVAIAIVAAIVFGFGPITTNRPDRGGSVPVGPLRIDPAAAEVKVTTTGRYHEVVFGNVLADPEAVRQALRRDGLNVTIRFLPASPSAVGTLVASYYADDIDRDKVRWVYRRGRAVDSDVLAVKIPLRYRGEMGLDFGRRARPGEAYSSVASSAQSPGEVLHCAVVEGERVRDVLSILSKRQVTATWRDPANRIVPVTSVLDRYVLQTVPVAEGQVLIFTSVERPDPAKLALLHPGARQGCPAR